MLVWTDAPDTEMITKLLSLPVEEKEKISRDIVKDSIANAENPFLCFSGGKKSTVLLHVIKNLSLCGAPPHDPASPVRAYKKALPKKNYTLYPIKRGYEGALNVLHIDTTVEFDNIYLYIEKMRKLWRFNLVRERRSVVEDIRIAENKEECCKKLITDPLKNAIEKYKIDCLFIGITWDEKEGEKFVSEGDVYVHPILHFTERDIWDYIRKYNLPYCSLYDQGYRKLDCKPCTKIVSERDESKAIQELNSIIEDRLIDKVHEKILIKLSDARKLYLLGLYR